MKIINSHYIPLPEPRWLIMTPQGDIYEQVGTLTVVEDASTKKEGYAIKIRAGSDEDLVLTAQFEALSYSVTVAPGATGVTDDNGDAVKRGYVFHRT